MSAFGGKADIGSSHDAAAEQAAKSSAIFRISKAAVAMTRKLLDLSLLPSYLKSISASG